MSQEQDSQTNDSEFEVLPEQQVSDAAAPEVAQAVAPKPAYSGPTPGQLLRAERERRELTLEDIVTQSRMSMETVKALEEDRDPPQNAWVYVRGYYRKYARVLGLPEEEILQAHELLTGGAPSPEPVSAEWAPQDVSPSSGIPKFILVLVAGIVFGGIIWWAMPMITGKSEKRQQPVEEASAADSGAPEVSVTRVVSPTPQTATRQPAGATQTGSNEAGVVAEEPETGVSRATDPAEDEVGAQAADTPESAAAGMPERQAAAAEPAATPPTGPALALQFSERSWVNVVDATGKKLLDGIVGADSRRELFGKPPFKVFLGYAPGVKVSYDGRLINTEQYTTSSNTARFTVEAAAGSAESSASP